MKIAQVCPYDFSRPGGVKNHIIGLTNALRTHGYQVDILTPLISNPDDELLAGVYQFGKKKSTTSRSTKIDLSLALGSEVKRLRAHLKKEQYDIIHYHNGWTPFLSYQIRFLSFFQKTKHLATFHDTPTDSWIGKYLVGKGLMPFGAFVMSFLGQAGISVSSSQSKYIKGLFFKPMNIIPNGIDLQVYEAEQEISEEYNDGKFNLLFVGRLEPRKGVLYALKAFALLKGRYEDIRLIIAGDGDGKEEAEAYVRDQKLDDVVFTGYIEENEKLKLMNTANVFLAPALFGESFGIVLLEAMAMGIPMVGFGNEGYKNVIKGEWLEYFPKPRDLDTFTKSLEKLYLNSDVRNRMITWGRKEVKQYDWKAVSSKVLKVYKEILK
ncbi:glycosyltransferase family 4 protein [Reichenbachiella sp. MALMAid0571]|uniref:glycosyltransferase family 4 protein n=1 Tax=Reichenbachiella sp. MALMAid0571 TaxID=3143939 RepID=UPI0032DEDDF0